MLADGGVLELRFSGPIVQADNFADFAAFVAVFLRFRGALLGLAEGVFCVADGFVDQVQRFSHTVFFLAAWINNPSCSASGQNCGALNFSPRRITACHSDSDGIRTNLPDCHSLFTLNSANVNPKVTKM